MSCCSCFSGLGGGDAPVRAGSKKNDSNLAMEKQVSNAEIEEFHLGLDFIAKVELFKTLPLPDHPAVARAFQMQAYSPGGDIITQGDIGDRFYCIKSGSAKVIIDGNVVNKLGPGDYFGEMALLHKVPRNATIQAEGNLQCHELSAQAFDALGLRQKLRFKKRKNVIQGEGETGGKPSKKTPEQATVIRECLRRNNNIGPFIKNMSDRELQDIVDEAYSKTVTAKDSEVITQGDLKADLFYILENGTGEAIKDGVKVASYVSKDSFGGLALLYQAPRAATVRVEPGSTLWCIPRGPFRVALQGQTKAKVEGYARLLGKVRCLDKVSAEHKRTLADALMETTYYKNEFIYREGDKDKSNAFYILQSGEVVMGGAEGGCTLRAVEGRDLPYFGERALISDEVRREGVKVTSDKATMLVLEREVYLQVTQEDMFHGDAASVSTQYNFDQLQTIGLLGCGGFGKVTLVKDTGHGGMLFALKALSKGHVLKECQQKSVMNEKRILRMTHSPFLVQVAATFNRKSHLMFLLEPAMGGELFTLYIKNKFYGNEKQAMFYSACVLRGLEHLHERCIIYRDMKPENLLLDVKGYCKIADFGLAKFVIGKTFTTCGTPDYFAPELLKGVGHTAALDWWTLGILIYEFMKGVTPFQADDPGQLFFKMMKGIETADFPRGNAQWADLVKSLCKLEPSERLPVRPGGVQNVINHPWFTQASFDWPKLTNRTMKAPWVPNVKNDCSNFDASEDDSPPDIPYRDPGDKWDAEFEDVMGPPTFD